MVSAGAVVQESSAVRRSPDCAPGFRVADATYLLLQVQRGTDQHPAAAPAAQQPGGRPTGGEDGTGEAPVRWR